MPDVANVVVRKGKCYTCPLAETQAGFYVDTEPVFVTDVDTDRLVAALEKVITLGHPKVPTPTAEEMRERGKLIPSAAGVGNWKSLAQGGAAYSIQWSQDGAVSLLISRLDEKGRFEWDPNKTRAFSGDTSLRTIAEAILDDVYSRPELAKL